MYRFKKTIMRKIFKTAAVFLGWSSCLAQASKCPTQQSIEAIPAPESEQTEKPNLDRSGLALFQNLDNIYYL